MFSGTEPDDAPEYPPPLNVQYLQVTEYFLTGVGVGVGFGVGAGVGLCVGFGVGAGVGASVGSGAPPVPSDQQA